MTKMIFLSHYTMAEEKKEDIIDEIYKASGNNFHTILVPMTVLLGPMYRNLFETGDVVYKFLSNILSAHKKLILDVAPAYTDLERDLLKDTIRLCSFVDGSIIDGMPIKSIMVLYYLKFNETVSHVLYANLFNDYYFYHNSTFISTLSHWKETYSNLITLQKMYDKIFVSRNLLFIYYDKPVDRSDVKWNCLSESLSTGGSKFDEFLGNLPKKDVGVRRYYSSFIMQNPAQEIEKWLKEWDVEPSGMGAQAAKEEFEDLAGVKK
jgi:hypothetical protein